MASVCCIIGNGGHARSVARLMQHFACVLLGPEDRLPNGAKFGLVAVGNPDDRARVFDSYSVEWLGIMHGHAWGEIAMSAHLMPGSVVMPNAVIGDNVLVNTGAQIDHDCVIGAHSHIAPGAILCGDVKIGERCFIGPGAVIVRGVTLDAGIFIPAGTLVVKQGDLRRPQRVLLHDRAGTAGASEGLLY